MSNNRQLEIEKFVADNCSQYSLCHLAGDASFRRYIRINCSSGSFMLMDAPPDKEDVRPFMAVCNYLRASGYSAPQIISANEQLGLLLLEDLGDDSFSRLLRVDCAPEEEYYRLAVAVLADWQKMNNSLNLPEYDHKILLTEASLFSNWFLPQIINSADLAALQAEYEALWRELLADAPLVTSCFTHRDYHADNLMWLPRRAGIKKLGLLDFQDALYGDPAYDLVSLLEDARRDVDESLAMRMIDYYHTISADDKERFSAAYAVLAAQRNSKIIGIFTRLAVRDGKEHYLKLLPRVWQHLLRDIEHPSLRKLSAWINKYIPIQQRGIIKIANNKNVA